MRRPPKNEDLPSPRCYHKSMSSENDNNLLNFIATTVETLRQRIDTISDQMATKIDLANLRDEMATELSALRQEMATKDDLAAVRREMATKDDLVALRREMATKDDLARVESTLEVRTTAIRGDIEQVHIRLDSIDRGVNTRMDRVETDISRLRSVLYLLVKDKPDMLRLLGQPARGENRS